MRRHVVTFVFGAGALALILSSAPASGRVAEAANQQPLRKEAKELMPHASSSEDYQKLAVHFDQKGQSLDAKAQEH